MSKTELEHRILELESMLCESEQFAAQMEVKCDRLRDALMSIEETCSGTSDEAMKIQEIIDNAIR